MLLCWWLLLLLLRLLGLLVVMLLLLLWLLLLLLLLLRHRYRLVWRRCPAIARDVLGKLAGLERLLGGRRLVLCGVDHVRDAWSVLLRLRPG